jgi:UDP-2,3-diacylglucosamine pyrophosphatase LpxH
MHYRAVFISDMHLASKKAKAKPLNDFLKHNTFETIYLVGDVIDIWRFRQAFAMSAEKQNEHLEVVERLLKHARKGTAVHYIWGNHDEFMAKFRGHQIFGSVSLHERMDHTTANGTRFLVLHGHQFDLLTKYPVSGFIYKAGDWAYEVLLNINEGFNWCRRAIGMRYWSVSKYIKVKVKRATQFIESFESVVCRYAKERGYGGVICGHLHDPKIKSVDGIVYANCGCWTEKDNCTFLYEDENGCLKVGSYARTH